MAETMQGTSPHVAAVGSRLRKLRKERNLTQAEALEDVSVEGDTCRSKRRHQVVIPTGVLHVQVIGIG